MRTSYSALSVTMSVTMRHVKRFWRNEDGFLISTEWLFWATIVAIGSIAAVMSLRYAAREVFVNTAAGIAAEQHYEFHTPGHEGYRVMTSPPQAYGAFEKLGETPGKSWETAPEGEKAK